MGPPNRVLSSTTFSFNLIKGDDTRERKRKEETEGGEKEEVTPNRR